MKKVMAGIDLHSNNLVIGIMDMDGKRVASQKLSCKLKEVVAFLSPFKKRLEQVAVESTYNWYWNHSWNHRRNHRNHRVTSQHLTIDLPIGRALLRFCSGSNAPRTVSPPSRRSHIPSSQPPPPVRSISIRTASAPNTAPNPDLDLHTVHERPPTGHKRDVTSTIAIVNC